MIPKRLFKRQMKLRALLSRPPQGERLSTPPSSALPVVISTPDAVHFNIGNQGFKLAYHHESQTDLDWMAEMLAIAFRNAGARVIIEPNTETEARHG